MATQIATAGPTLSLHTEHCLSTRPYAPGSKHHTCSSDLANAGLLRGTSSLNACSSSGSFYDLPIPSHGKNHSIPKVPATPKCQSLPAWSEAPRMWGWLIWAQSAQSSAVQRSMWVMNSRSWLAWEALSHLNWGSYLMAGNMFSRPHNGSVALQLTSQGYRASHM